MAGVVHAILLLSLAATTLLAAARWFAKPSLRRALVSLLGGAMSAFGAALVSLHRCGLGQPVAQWLIPGACMSASLMLVGSPIVRRVLAGASLVMAFVLSLHYAAEVHGPIFVGSMFVDEHSGVGPVHREWHTWISGLYRRGRE